MAAPAVAAANPASFTGHYLAPLLGKAPPAPIDRILADP